MLHRIWRAITRFMEDTGLPAEDGPNYGDDMGPLADTLPVDEPEPGLD